MKRIWCHNASIASRLARALWIPDAPLLHRTIVNVHSFWYSNFHSKRKVSDRFTMHFGSFVIKILWLNYRIEGHLYTSQIREYPPPDWSESVYYTVLYVVFQKILTHVKQVVWSGPAFCIINIEINLVELLYSTRIFVKQASMYKLYIKLMVSSLLFDLETSVN